MSDRVSDGLLAELQAKIDDGTERGMVWDLLAPLLITVAACAITPEEVAMTNEALAAMILDGDDRAFERIAIRETLATLVDYNEQRKRDSS